MSQATPQSPATRQRTTGEPSSPGAPPAIATSGSEAGQSAEQRFPIIAREGWPIIGAVAAISAALVALSYWLLGPVVGVPVLVIGGLITLWAFWFFRDPPRRTPAAMFIAPADGVVSFVGLSSPPAELGLHGPFTRVSIFMNVFNVHVNRCPADARVAAVHYRPGKFFNASLDKASEHNERCALRLTLADGTDAACVQIAGLIARRIVCRAKPGDSFRAGQRFGLIRFGSRVDVYLREGLVPLVKLGQATVAGETILVAAPTGEKP